ncbi:hypothetical protein SADUNF_Sadunf15G0038900 [Salix dunnii]|uniref:HP domain-containing protein n=1 Tax=Salix dunnii TaxID=1413687 RepID=A0A835JDD0_9ROSI|nr:hypothetical protein SADUNF_Sadunf15G0038900 [Salix dunnii]
MLTYLSAVEFGEKFGMAKDVFYKLPKWKQNKLKMALDFDFEQSRAVDFERKLIVGETSVWIGSMCCHAFVVGLLNFHGKCLARQYVLFCFWVARDSSSKPKRFAVFQVYLNRAHLTSWKNDHGEELLFVSSKAIFKPPKAIHGGIPICSPQGFGSHDSLEQHGFARNRFWSIDTDPRPFPINSKSFIDLILKPFEEDMQKWRRRNTNADGKPFTFTFVYHTYFSASDIRNRLNRCIHLQSVLMLNFEFDLVDREQREKK